MTTNRIPSQPINAQSLRPLTTLVPGERGLAHIDSMRRQDRELLEALGLLDRSPVRLCKAGSPWIVQVRGTRIGLSEDVARRLLTADPDLAELEISGAGLEEALLMLTGRPPQSFGSQREEKAA